jgi:hypothetical protein
MFGNFSSLQMDTENEKCIKTSKTKTYVIIGLSVLSGFLFVAFVVTFTVMLIYIVKIAGYNSALHGALDNLRACSSASYLCAIPSYSQEVPEIVPETFDKDVAIFVGQLVTNVEYQDQIGGLGIPEGLTLVGELITTTDAPIFGYVATDSISETMYIIFRGTETPEEWQQDFTFKQFEVPDNYFETVNFEGIN